ncbi:PIR protein [Plasmodium vivax]|uniref:VIR protein n=1 Tax=Plasmodium vivax TaxID=5855 RepID=A0A565A4R5_PLAVI|nr:PIR protein [Plasmodium vivax]
MSYPSLDYYENSVDNPEKIHNLFSDFPLYIFYKKLDKDYESCNDEDIHEKCDFCTGQIQYNETGGQDILKLCKHTCHIISKAYGTSIPINNITNDKLCNYTSFWLYNYIKRIPNYLFHIDKLYSTLSIVCKTISVPLKFCSLKKDNIHIYEFNYRKILFEFLEIYDYIKSKLDHQNDPNIQLYCNHIKENFRNYNIIKKSCKNKDTCEYYDDLEAYRKKFIEEGVLSTIYEKCDYTKTPCAQGSNAEDDVPCLREKGNSFLYQIFGNDAENIINILLKVTTISAPILVLFVILFKFTPFGKNLNKLKQERKKSGHKKKEVNIQDYMKNYAAHLDSEMKNRVHLGYHAT